MGRAALLIALALASACSPQPKDGAYRCGSDGACPGSLACVCGLCVRDRASAACGFLIEGAPARVTEHQRFHLRATALVDGAPSRYSGRAQLSASWGGVSPSEIDFVGGVADALVALDRETTPPQTAAITLTVAATHQLGPAITVAALSLRRSMPDEVTSDGAGALGPPSVVRLADGRYAMYRYTTRFEAALSSDGLRFGPFAAVATLGPVGPQPFVGLLGDGSLAVVSTNPDGSAITYASSSGDPFAFGAAATAIDRPGCGWCEGMLSAPAVAALPDGRVGLVFAALRKGIPAIGSATGPSLGALQATPAPILSSDLADEGVLAYPRLFVDGAVWRLFYSSARFDQICCRDGSGTLTRVDLCAAPTAVKIGSATSSDGLFWVRSPQNASTPLAPGQPGGRDAASLTLAVGSILPLDGGGEAIYYAPYLNVAGVCELVGAARAVATPGPPLP